MIHGIRKLARAIHRRSVWLVVGVYVLMSWALLAAVEAITAFGLPSWTPTMTLLLLVMLLPLIVATAAVQGGIPGLRIEDEVDPNELEGLTPDQVLVIPEAHPLHGTSVLTWRNAVLGSVSSAALLLTSVVTYMVMWSLGIGPVGSLLVQGLIVEQDRLVVAEFANRTNDASLGAAVTDLFEVDLAESDVVSVMGSDQMAAALVQMGHPFGVPVTPTLARDLALEEGINVIVEGAVSRRGAGYLVAAEIVIPSEGSSPARYQEPAPGEADLLPAIDRLSERVREKLGESLRAIRQGETIERFGSESEDAQRLFALAGEAALAGAHDEAIELFTEVLTFDPGFALAWRKLGVVYEQVSDTAAAIDSYRRVVELWPGSESGGRRTVQFLRERLDALED